MKAQRDWCGLIGWLLAASLMALQAGLVKASETPDGPSISINRGESYVIKGVSPDSEPEVKPIDNPHSLIVNKQPDGSVLVLGAEAGSEAVRVKLADGKLETYTVTVHASADPNNPLAPGSEPVATSETAASGESATPLDPGTGPTAGPLATNIVSASNDAPATSAPHSGSDPAAATEPHAASEPARAIESHTASERPLAAEPHAASEPPAASETAPATEAPASGSHDASAAANAQSASASETSGVPEASSSAPTPAENAEPADAAKPAADSSARAPLDLSPASGSAIASQAASEASQKAVQTYKTDPRVGDEPEPPGTSARHYLPEDAISLMFGNSRVFDFAQRIKRVSIADSEIADLQVINPHQLMLIGHKPGFTTLAVWDNQGHYEERQVRIEQSGHQQVLLNCTVAEVNRSRLESQGLNYSGTLANSGVSVVGLPGAVATP